MLCGSFKDLDFPDLWPPFVAEREIGTLCQPSQQQTCFILDNNNKTIGWGQNQCEFGWWSSTCYNVTCQPGYQLLRRAPIYQDTCIISSESDAVHEQMVVLQKHYKKVNGRH